MGNTMYADRPPGMVFGQRTLMVRHTNGASLSMQQLKYSLQKEDSQQNGSRNPWYDKSCNISNVA